MSRGFLLEFVTAVILRVMWDLLREQSCCIRPLGCLPPTLGIYTKCKERFLTQLGYQPLASRFLGYSSPPLRPWLLTIHFLVTHSFIPWLPLISFFGYSLFYSLLTVFIYDYTIKLGLHPVALSNLMLCSFWLFLSNFFMCDLKNK